TPHLNLDGARITQDRLNSLLEYEQISRLGVLRRDCRVLEIGAGSGRTAACLLSLVPGLKYIIADIPPALFLSYGNLRDLFPELRVAAGFTVQSRQELDAVIAGNDLIFVFPDQLRHMADKSIDLFLAVDCL